MKIILSFITCLFSFLALAQPPVSLNWVKQMGGARYDSGNALTADQAGNIYVAGGFQDDADFDPGAGEVILNGQTINDWLGDVFVAKYDDQGNLLWVNGAIGTKQKGVKDIELDIDGNVLISGWFTGTVAFGIDQPQTFSTDDGITENFVVKLSNDGEMLWVSVFGYATDAYGVTAFDVDQQGNSVITGQFTDTGDFDPGASEFELTATGDANSFIVKLDGNGDFVWAKAISDTLRCYGICLEIDSSGNIYTSGGYMSTVDLDPGVGIVNATAPNGQYDTYLVKLDPNGNFIWEKHFGGQDVDQATTLTLAESGNIYLTGLFIDDNTDLDPGNGVFTLPFNDWVDSYIMKWDENGNFVWAKGIGGEEYDAVHALRLDENENLFIAGRFRMDVDFDPGPGTYMMSSLGSGSDDAFIMRLDQDGEFVWAGQVHGNMNYINAIDFAPDGGIYATGNFGTQTDFEPGTGVFNQTPVTGYPDAFIFKWSEAEGVSTEELSPIENLFVYPNPFAQQLSVAFTNQSNNATVRLYNGLGELVLQREGIATNKVVLDTDQLASGLYTAEIRDGDAVERVKVVK